ncbi:MAG: DUF1206 domain-containing protein [Nocardioides sp.]
MNDAARAAHQSDWVDRMASAGLVAYGVVHLVIGWLAAQLALGDRDGGASSTGAVKELAQQPFGQVLVWLVAIGLVLLVAWQALDAAIGHRREDEPTRTRKRLTSAGKAAVYAAIAASAFTVATGSSSSGGSGTDPLTARLMNLPGGQALVFAVGLAVAGVGVAHLVTAWRESYLDKVDGQGSSGHVGRAYRVLARTGYAAKGVALLVVGGLFGYAAITHEAKKSGGLDQALTKVLDAPFGPVLLLAIGVGFIAYGLYCFVQARYLDR